jgi:hypothetical protein
LLSSPSAIVGVEKVPTGSDLGWAMVLGVTSVIGGICAGILNTAGELSPIRCAVAHFLQRLLHDSRSDR